MSTAQTLLGVLEVILLFGGIPMGVSALVLVFMHLSERDNADELRTDSRSPRQPRRRSVRYRGRSLPVAALVQLG